MLAENGLLRPEWQAFKGYLTEFGLTPSSRARIKAEPAAKGKTLADILFTGVTNDK